MKPIDWAIPYTRWWTVNCVDNNRCTDSVLKDERAVRVVRIAVIALVLVAGCATPPEAAPEPQDLPLFELNSDAFFQNGDIPAKYTCDGDGALPALFWHGFPDETQSFALIMEDLDADFDHWLWWNLDVNQTATFAERTDLPRGETSAGGLDYVPPCPPAGDGKHRYVWTMYAVAGTLTLPNGSDRAALDEALAEAAVAKGVLRGVYERGE